MDKKLPTHIIEARAACLSHAEDLIKSANRILSDENLPHIAYHLATLAFEEIGKATLIGLVHVSDDRKDPNWNPEKFLDDHVKKLFWAFWGPSFGREKITKDQIESLQGLSKGIHEKRLEGLYVELKNEIVNLPREAISKKEAESFLTAANARLELAKLSKYDNAVSDDKIEIMTWFLNATDDTEKRKMIMGAKSMEKLVELGSVHSWIDWLKQQFDEAEAEGLKQAKRELKRKIDDKDIEIEKWKIKIRFFSSSHSIRPKALNWWNNISTWIKLFPVGNQKNQFIAEFTLPKSVPLQALWWAGWNAARRFIAALNIGSFGCFWWYLPDQTSKFYEKIVDIEAQKTEVRIERSPVLKLDWQRGALSETDLRNTALCFGNLPNNNEGDFGESLGNYMTGLAFLNKSDIHLQFESNAYELFLNAFKMAMKHYKRWDGQSPFANSFEQLCRELQISNEEKEKHIKLFSFYEKFPPSPTGITLTEVGMIKLICDAFYLLRLREDADRKRISNKKSA